MNLNDSSLLIAYVSFILFILGTVFGSFINCVAGRIVAGENWISGKSHCEECGHELGPLDLVPVLSYVFLGGKCRYCHKHLTARYVLVEIAMGILFVWCFLSRKILDLKLVQQLILTVILMGLSLVDLDSYIIPDGFIVAGIINWLWMVFFVPDKGSYLLRGLISGFAIAGIILVLSLVMDRILDKESLGGGDIKLIFMVCLYINVIQGTFLLIFACLIGLLFVILLKKEKIAFGPSISMAAFLVVLYGGALQSIYMGLF